MDKSNPPTSFGVFKPVGHVVIAFESPALVEAATSALLEHGFMAQDLVRYSPEEMIAQVDAHLAAASPLASLGQDLNLIKAHKALAAQGCSFLVVHTPTREKATWVATLAQSMKATAAQRYGMLIVEELIDSPGDAPQVFESPDRGLDMAIPEDPGR